MNGSEVISSISILQALVSGVVVTAVLSIIAVLLLRHSYQKRILLSQDALKSVQDRDSFQQDEIKNLLEQTELLKSKLNKLQTDLAVLNTQLKQSEGEKQNLSQNLKKSEDTRDSYHSRIMDLEKMHLSSEKDLLAAEDKIKLLKDTEENLRKNFENLANRIFEEKTSRFVNQNKESVNQLINPLREQIGDFRKKVEDVYYQESKERTSLLAEINQLKNLNLQMSQDAVNLTNALKGESKTQGNWGEVILERVLEESGLSQGREYDTQVVLKNDAGQRYIPDVIIKLPENRQIIIDAKVSLLDYENYCSNEDDLQKETSIKQHIASLRKHITSLSEKDYASLEGITTLDFVFIFIPIEAAFMLAFEKEPRLFQEAFDKKIIIVSPTTLLATLRTVESIWRYESQNKNAEEIARQAGSIYDQLALVVEALDNVGDHLDKAQQAHHTAIKRMHTGKGNLISKVDRLEKLGAKVKKKIPDKYLDTYNESEQDENFLAIESSDKEN